MGRSYVHVTASTNCLIACKCVKCGQVFVEPYIYTSEYGVSYGAFQRGRATEKARNSALNSMATGMMQFVPAINVGRKFRLLKASGRCTNCGAHQPWRRHEFLRWGIALLVGVLVGLAVIPLAILLNLHIFMLGAPVAGYFAGAQALKRADIALEQRAIRQLEELNDPHVYPLIIHNRIPEGIRDDDPRLLAILQVFAQRQALAQQQQQQPPHA